MKHDILGMLSEHSYGSESTREVEPYATAWVISFHEC